MLTYALVIFAIGALGGLILAGHVMTGRFAPWVLSIGHGLLGATGIALLIAIVMQGAAPARVTAALGLFVVAALGGFFLASLHYRQRIPPKAFVLAHASVAVVAFLTLLSVVLAL